MDLARAPRRAPLTARKKGSGYENAPGPQATSVSREALGPRMVRCVPGPREDACGREALGTRMITRYDWMKPKFALLGRNAFSEWTKE
jgi:hypothetical protein